MVFNTDAELFQSNLEPLEIVTGLALAPQATALDILHLNVATQKATATLQLWFGQFDNWFDVVVVIMGQIKRAMIDQLLINPRRFTKDIANVHFNA